MLTKVSSLTFSPNLVDARDSMTALALKSWCVVSHVGQGWGCMGRVQFRTRANSLRPSSQ